MASGEVDGERGRNGGIFDLVEKRSKVRTRELTRNELRDYALIEGREQFDKISSIGMFEAIGVSHFRTYFETVHRLDDLGRTIFNLELYGFEIHDVEGWRGRYPRTCRFWHDRLRARHDEACEEVEKRRRESGSPTSQPPRSRSSATLSGSTRRWRRNG